MNTVSHALVWIDHHEAKIFQFDAGEVDSARVKSSDPHQHLHHKANSGDSGHAAVDTTFLEQVSHALRHAGSVLITGPASAKTELAAHIEKKAPELAKRIAGIQTLDHPTDGELLRLARAFFAKEDRKRSLLNS